MQRNVTNVVRWVMDEMIPPAIRDSRWFMYPFFVLAYRTTAVSTAMDYKALVGQWTSAQYAEYYRGLNTISRNRETDLNRECVGRILESIPPGTKTLLDAGCGKGYLLQVIAEARPEIELYGLDVLDGISTDIFSYRSGHVEALPFADNRFDVVISSHTLEHIVPLSDAISELKRVAAGRLIVVVPRQRKYYYTLDEHVNFFTYDFELISAIGSDSFLIEDLRGDWFYSTDDTVPAGSGPSSG